MKQIRNNGFTLIEIMVVLVIMGIMAATVVINVSAPSYNKFLSRVNIIAKTLSLLSDHAVYTNSVVMCEVKTKGIRCKSYRDEEWQDLDMAKEVPWAWPDDVNIAALKVNGVDLMNKSDLPSVIKFLPSGDNPVIEVQIQSKANKDFDAWIDSDMSGNFKVSN